MGVHVFALNILYCFLKVKKSKLKSKFYIEGEVLLMKIGLYMASLEHEKG